MAQLHLIDEDRTALAHGFSRIGVVLESQPDTDETLGQLAVGLFSDELVASVPAPEIDAAGLKEFAGSAAKELDQRGSSAALGGLGRNPQEERLKGIVRVGRSTAFG